ncbi:nucleotide-binding universal stress UspA family protein [Geomicrobium halophilum]|uniref:Nucleotide-binding universal stress UspA family protein n=1 Tax=Geomicrobium halophilum TaxID=549000 RepID=A0A841PYM4_9BACL|nr:nucleotide-binding universal stress UspA family protein [Geomicrobium halophilum]
MKRTEEEAHETLIKYQRRAIDKGLTNTETIFETGSPSIKITQHIVPNYNIDLVMIGANQGNKVERILVGSVSDAIIKSASCDVITVRSADIDHKAKNNLFIRSNKNTHEG